MSLTYTFDVEQFRVWYPEFADDTAYPDATLQMNFDTSGCYITNCDYGWLSGDCRYKALTLMTAHLTRLGVMALAQQTPGYEQQATIDKVTVTLTPPPVTTSQFRWWLNTTPYGMQLSAMLAVYATGGFYVGGLPETAAFRRVGGIFI